MAAKGDDFSDFATTPPPSAGSPAPAGESFDDFGTAPPDGSAPASLPVRTKKPDEDKTDYGAMPWTEVGKRGILSTPAAVESGAKTAYKLITNPLQTAKGLYDLGHGAVSHVNRWAYDLPSTPESDAIEAPINETAKENWQNWSSVPGIKKHIATNLPGTLLDVSTLAGGVGGVAGTAAKVADPLGAMSKLAETAGTVAERTNPLTGFGVASDALASKIKAPDLIDAKTGAAHPTVDAVIKHATDQQHDFQSLFGGADPAVQKRFIDTLQAKGVTGNAAKEGILASADMTPTRTASTGAEAETGAAKELAAHTAQDNEIGAAKTLGKIVGPQDNTDIHGIAKALDQARVNSLNAAVAPLERAKNIPGQIDPTVWGGKSLMGNINQALAQKKLPIEDILSGPQFPQAQAALDYIQKRLPNASPGQTSAPLQAANLANIRQGIGKLQRDAMGSDQAAVGTIIDAFDNHVASAIKQGAWTDAAGKALPAEGSQFLQNLQQGRAAYAKHMETFHDRGGGNGTIASATKPMLDDEVGSGTAHAPGLGDDTYQSIQSKLSSALSSDSNKADTLTRLQNALGPDPVVQKALRDYMRRKVMIDPKTGGIAHPDAINAALTKHGNIAGRLFTPQEQAQIQHINAARSINGARVKAHAAPDSLFKTMRRAGTGILGKAILAKMAGSVIPGGEILGLIGGEGVGHISSHLKRAGELKRELRGADAHHTIKSRIRGAGRYAAGALTNPLTGQLGANVNFSNNLVPARATGGSVNNNHDRLVGRLMALAESAKREEKKTTKSILGVPDDTVTAALAKANEAVQT